LKNQRAMFSTEIQIHVKIHNRTVQLEQS